MNIDIFKGSWEEVKGKVKQKWAAITDDDLLRIEGRHDEIYGILEKRYGHSKEEIDKLIEDL